MNFRIFSFVIAHLICRETVVFCEIRVYFFCCTSCLFYFKKAAAAGILDFPEVIRIALALRVRAYFRFWRSLSSTFRQAYRDPADFANQLLRPFYDK